MWFPEYQSRLCTLVSYEDMNVHILSMIHNGIGLTGIARYDLVSCTVQCRAAKRAIRIHVEPPSAGAALTRGAVQPNLSGSRAYTSYKKYPGGLPSASISKNSSW